MYMTTDKIRNKMEHWNVAQMAKDTYRTKPADENLSLAEHAKQNKENEHARGTLALWIAIAKKHGIDLK